MRPVPCRQRLDYAVAWAVQAADTHVLFGYRRSRYAELASAIGGADTPNLHRLSGVADTPMPVMVRLATTAFESGGCARRAMLGCVIVNA